MLLLQEFDLEIRDKKGVENAVVDHLSQIERGIDPLPIRDEFLDEQILQLEHGASRAYKEKLESDVKYYMWDDPYLWKLYDDQVHSESRDLIDPPFLSFNIRRRLLWIKSNNPESPRL
ncbi:hypothetical protein CR513_07071, partial [Mucuna pruriens]